MPKKFQIGSIPGMPEARVSLDNKGFIPMPVLQTRSTIVHAFLSVSPPENADEEFWNTVRDCLILASAGAAVAGVISGGMAALPTFLRVFGAQATSRGLELAANQIQLVTETAYGEWC